MKGRIAIIDDDAMVRAATASLLRSEGYEAEPFRLAADFLASDLSFECVISDVRMPGLTGLDLLQRLGNGTSKLPVVLVSAYCSDAMRKDAEALEAFALLDKPVDGEALLELVGEALRFGSTALTARS